MRSERESITQARETERKFKKQNKEKWQINKSNHKMKPPKKDLEVEQTDICKQAAHLTT